MRSSGANAGPPAGVLSFLNSVLSARGPQALPYVEEHKWGIREQVMQLLTRFPSLSPSNAHFTHNDGRTVHLLRVQGTLPITFQGVKYNIPVCFWLPEGYPRTAPLCFVTPTADMVVKAGHPHVDANGAVAAPCLLRWTFPSHTLCGCADQLAEIFSRDPPLYSKPPGGSAAVVSNGAAHHHAQHQAQQQQQHMHVGSPPTQQHGYPQPQHQQVSGFAAGSAEAAQRWAQAQHQPRRTGDGEAEAGVHHHHHEARPHLPSNGPEAAAPPAATPAPPPPQPPPPPPPRPAGPPPEETFRLAALEVLTQRARECMLAAASAESDDVAALLDEQRVLEDRRVALSAALAPLRAEREGLEHHVSALRAATAALDAWLAENSPRVPADLTADEALQAEDAWGRQALTAAAEDAAVEDTLYVLAQGLEAGVVPLEQYLRQVRALCREQFFARATVLVVQAARAQRAAQ